MRSKIEEHYQYSRGYAVKMRDIFSLIFTDNVPHYSPALHFRIVCIGTIYFTL